MVTINNSVEAPKDRGYYFVEEANGAMTLVLALEGPASHHQDVVRVSGAAGLF